MSTTALPNSKPPRKQLSDQLDRLESILECLSNGLDTAVADAAREGTRLAVKDAIVEILTDPNLRARLHQASAPEATPEPPPPANKPSLWTRLKARVGQVVTTAGRMVSQAVTSAVRGVQTVTTAAVEGLRAVGTLGSLKKLALVGLGVGAVVGLASFLAPHALSAVLSGISSAVAATTVQVGVWARRTCRALNLV